jgi:ATP-dependent Clp protease, protease subunit
MPLPNFHTCHIKDTDAFEDDSFRTIKREHEGKEYSVIIGKLKGEDSTTEESYRYNKDTWGESEAKSHCKDHDGSFEAASGEETDKIKPSIKNYRSPFQLKKAPLYRIENKAEDTIIYLYDEIGGWGTPAEQVVKDITAVKAGTLHIRINSPGGYVFDGVSIYNAIKQAKVKTIAHVDGLAASISSVIAMGADERRMGEGAFLMIHEPWSMVMGNAADLRKEADLLDKIRDTIIKTYMEASGKKEDEIKEWMNKETWFNADEAMEFGFVSEIEQIEAKDTIKPTLFNLSSFKNVPDELREDTKNSDEEDNHSNKRKAEKALRDAGFSRNDAVKIVAKGFQDEGDPQNEQVDQDVGEPQSDADKPQSDSGKATEQTEEKADKRDKVTDLIIRATLVTLGKAATNN